MKNTCSCALRSLLNKAAIFMTNTRLTIRPAPAVMVGLAMLLMQSAAFALPPACTDPAADPTTQIITVTSPANNSAFAAGTTPVTVTFSTSGTRGYFGANWTLSSSAAATQSGSIGSTIKSIDFASLGAANYSVVISPKIGIIGSGCEVTQTDGSVAFSITAAAPISQTVTGFAPATPITYSPGGTFALSATGGASGNPVTFGSATPSVCTVSAGTASVITSGTCTLTANQAGNAAYSAAPMVIADVVINKANQSIVGFDPPLYQSGKFPFNVNATASSGLPVSVTTTTPAVCSIFNTQVTISTAGTCTLVATQAGNANWNAAPQRVADTVILKSNQTITFGALSTKTFGDAPFAVGATTSSALAVTFSATTPAVCSVSGATVTVGAPGTCSIAADQGGNVDYNAAAQVVQSFSVVKGNQTISFAALANKAMGDTPFAVGASTTSGLGVSFSSTTTGVCTVAGSTVTVVASGTCTIATDQGGNTNYNAAPQSTQSFAINKNSQTINFGPLGNKALGDVPFAVSASASSGFSVSISSTTPSVCLVSGNMVTMLAAGTCTIVADQAGNMYFSPAPQVVQSFSIAAPAYVGYSQNIDCRSISGWAWNSNLTSMPIGVDIYDGGALLTTTLAGNYESQLVGGTAGTNHGFSITTPASVMDGQAHTISVKFAGTQTSITGASPKVIACLGLGDPVQQGNASRFVSQSVPPTMVTGQIYSVTVIMKNVGTTAWASSTAHSLGSQNPQDNSTWGLGRVALPATITTGGTATFTFNVTAPAPGSYNFQWEMVQDGVQWFGGASANAAITVSPVAVTTAPPAVTAAPPAYSGASPTPAGKLGGSLGVSASGAATFSIPIKVPPGTVGMVPSVSLDYNSNGSNGLMGMGWSINGLSTIERCARTFIQDGVRASADLSANDRFCMGGRRLVAINGTYGATNSEYRTELESFSKIVAVGQTGTGPSSFLVSLKNGMVMEYGATSDSRIIPSGQTGVIIWALNKVRDVRGNYYTVTYVNDGINGQYYPSRIDYTGFTPFGAGTASAPYNSLRFLYDQNRSDVETSYRLGAKSQVTARLRNVQTFAGEALVRDYRVAYNTSTPTGRSRVDSITECTGGATPQCLPPTAFAWSDDANNFNGTPITWATEDAAMLAMYGGALAVGSTQHLWIDINGDGRPDLCTIFRELGANPNFTYTYHLFCALTQSAGNQPVIVEVGQFISDPGFNPLKFADVNGDGITDICGLSGFGRADVGCVLMGSAGIAGYFSEPSTTNGYFKRWFVDVNGDGRADICTLSFVGSYSTQSLACSLSTGTAFAPSVVVGTFNYSCSLGADYVLGCGPVQFDWADVTGDGVPSFCRAESNTMTCQKWTAAGLASPVSGTYAATTDARAWVDVNGDGKADFCRMNKTTAPQGTIACTLSSGISFGDTVSAPVADLGTNQQWVDVNGDGKADFCRVLTTSGTDNYVDCVLSTGSAFAGSVSSPIGVNGIPTIVDANGDTRTDVCYEDPPATAATSAKCLPFQGNLADKLYSVVDGLGAASSVAYKFISDSAIYAKGSGATYPVADVQVAMQVVSSINVADGIGSGNLTSYNYAGLRVHRQGWGNLGFSSIFAYKPNNTRVQTDFMQDYPYIGSVKRTLSTHLASGNVLSDTNTNYSSTNFGGNSYFVFPTSTITKSNDLNGSFLNWIEQSVSNYDAYGNLQLVSTVFKDINGNADSYSQSISTTYVNDSVNWILGLPTSIAQTNAVPGGAGLTRTTTMSYFPNGLLQETIAEPNNGGLAGMTNLRRVTDFTYDVYGNLLTRTVSGAYISTRTETAMTYDSRGQFVATAKNALNQQETRSYDPRFGTQSSLIDPNGLTSTWAYDGFGRRLTETRADGTFSTTDYSQCIGCIPRAAYSVGTTNKTATGAVASPPSRTYYDILGRPLLTRKTSFDGNEVYQETGYDGLGRVAYASQNYYSSDSSIRWTQNTYDDLGRPTVSVAPDHGQTSYTYNGRTVSTLNPKGQKQTQHNNSQGQTDSIINADGSGDSSRVTYTYEPFGNLATTTDSLGNVTALTYDLLGRKTGMIDPDMGSWIYSYDNVGQLLTQTNAKGQVATMAYDLLGRLTQRTEADLVSNWYYDTNQASVACNKGIGKLCEAKTTTGYDRLVSYDSLGRPASSTTTIDTAYTSSWTYDAAGRLDTTTYPQTIGGATLVVKNIYNANGYLSQIKNNGTAALLWQQNSKNADGNILSETYGNGVIATSGYDPLTGRLTSIAAGVNNAVQNQTYHYDSVGNLDIRTDAITGTNETFSHDNLNRLVTANLSGPGVTGVATTTVAYNAIGNITSKTSTLASYNVGTYTYNASGVGSVRPHAVTSVAGTVNGIANPAYGYDTNGNLNAAYGKAITWTSFDMPNSIARGTGASSFLYSPEHQRVKQMWPNPNTPTNVTVYLFDPQYEKEINGSLTEHKHYILAGSRIVALYTKRSDGTEDTKYFHADHLGSTSVVTDSAGNVLERMAYDPWGDRRASTGASAGAADPTNAIIPSTTDRGYTGHEHLDLGGMGLIHMNGRIYDPTLGRFLSPDPTIQSPYHSQSYNRYSYVWNNPLTSTDPSGYESSSLLRYPGGWWNWSGTGLDLFANGNSTSGMPLNESNNSSQSGTGGSLQCYVDAKPSITSIIDELAFKNGARIERAPANFFNDTFVGSVIADFFKPLALFTQDNRNYLTNRYENFDGGNRAEAGINLLTMGLSGELRTGAAVERQLIYVIGRDFDTAVAKDWAGHAILDIKDWSIVKNDAWMAKIFEERGILYLGSPQTSENLWDAVNNRMRVFQRELEQSAAAGYKQVGDYLYPPPKP